MTTFIKNVIGLWLILITAILPFPYFLVKPFFYYPSDSIITYYLSGVVLFISLLISALHCYFTIINQKILIKFLYTSIAYILSYFLLKYGIDKLLLRQFYTPEPNILFTPVGMLSKDILFWSSMGTSKSYNIFMGLIEIIPGLLLLYHRTRILGALIAFGVLLNVFMINIGFDITVKYLSLYLIVCCIFLLSPVLKKLFDLFIKQKAISTLKTPRFSFPKSRINRLLKASVICLLLTDVILPYLEQKSNFELQIDTLVGSYENKSVNSTFLNHQIKRVHIHSKGYFIIEDYNSNFFDYKFTMIGNAVYLLKEKTPVQIDLNSDTIAWKEDEKQKAIQYKKINKSQIPLLKDEIHWTYEQMN